MNPPVVSRPELTAPPDSSASYILVCDDEAHIRAVIAAKLTGNGLSVKQGRTGAEGLALALERPPTLIITDLQMPLMSGLEMAQRLKANPITAHVPVLMLTARGYTLTPGELALTNIREVVAKPFGVKQLMERVASLVSANALPALPDTNLAQPIRNAA